MRRRAWWAAGAVTAVAVLAWPGPAASADTSLGGYTADAAAAVAHIELFEPVIPIPSDPQGDFSVGYTHSGVQSGPSTRATASYLWPGAVIGDGFDQLTNSPGTKYPVQVNSRFPATTDAPATNRAQLTDGNGMSTSTDGADTHAHVAGLGIAGPQTDLLGGLGDGLGQLGGGSAPSTPPAPKAPVPVGQTLASLLSADNMTSTTDVSVGDTAVTTTASAAASKISILQGLLGIDGLSVTTKITSNGKTATATGSVHIGALTIAGVPLGLGDQGALLGKNQSVSLPTLPAALKTVLTQLGVSLDVTPVARKVTGATGSYAASGLVITIDTTTLKTALDGPLGLLVNLLGPDAATNLAPLLQLKPRLVIKLGDLTATTSASPAYSAPSGGGVPPPAGGTGAPPVSGGTGGTGSTGGYVGGSTGGGTTGGLTGTTGGGSTGGSTGGVSTPATQTQQAALALSPLGAVPKALILGGLVLAAALGWVLQTTGGALLGGAGPCRFGLATGVPDLRRIDAG